MFFPNIKKRYQSIFSLRAIASITSLLLSAISIALIALELSFLPQWVKGGVIMPDLYVYLGITGCICLINIIGFVMIRKRSRNGIYTLFIIVSSICMLQFVVGMIHIILLFRLYRPKLVERCLQRQSPQGFWWSFGYESVDDINKAFYDCQHDWIRFVAVHLFSWLIYSFIACICLSCMLKYYFRLKRNLRSDLDKMVHSSWKDEPISPDDEGQQEPKEKFGSSSTSSSPIPPNILCYSPTTRSAISLQEKEANEAIALEKHAQRQRLYEEIAKRRQRHQTSGSDTASLAGSMKSISLKSPASSAASSKRSSRRYSYLSGSNIHPFDVPITTTAHQYDHPAPETVGPPAFEEPQQHPQEQTSLLTQDQRAAQQEESYDEASTLEKEPNAPTTTSLLKDTLFPPAQSRRSSRRHPKLPAFTANPQSNPYHFPQASHPMSSSEVSGDLHHEGRGQEEGESSLTESGNDSSRDSDADESGPLNPFQTHDIS